jgi:hypothetical protein
MASMVGPGTVAAALLAPYAKTRVGGRSRWNFWHGTSDNNNEQKK